MPRPVAIRSDYRNDAGFLLRLESALVKDTRQTEEWRKKATTMARQFAMLLLEADTPKDTSGGVSVARGSTGRKTSPLSKAAAK